MCYGFVPVENPTSFVLKSPQKILHKIRPKVRALILYRGNISALSSLVDLRRTVLSTPGALSNWLLVLWYIPGNR